MRGEQTRRENEVDRLCGASSSLGFLAGLARSRPVLVTGWGESGGGGRLPRFFCVRVSMGVGALTRTRTNLSAKLFLLVDAKKVDVSTEWCQKGDRLCERLFGFPFVLLFLRA